MVLRNKPSTRPAEADKSIYEAIQSFVEHPRFMVGTIETEHEVNPNRLDGLGQVRLVRILVATDSGIEPSLDTMFVKQDPDCDSPCQKLKSFLKSISRDFSIS